MKKNLIITGGSKGIGRALVTEYNNNGFHVFSISRTTFNNSGADIEQIQFDLTDINGIENMFQEIFNKLDTKIIEKITLINNAASIGNISALANNNISDIYKTTQINIAAPLALSSLFIRHTQNLRIQKTIINISSGAALRPIAGWITYCSSKAALDMIIKGIGAEQSDNKNGVKAISIYPGVVDTEMQATIRKSDKTDFKEVQRFIDLKNNSGLADPKIVAEKKYSVDKNNTTPNGTCIDIKTIG